MENEGTQCDCRVHHAVEVRRDPSIKTQSFFLVILNYMNTSFALLPFTRFAVLIAAILLGKENSKFPP
jgi:hypothetical protein